MPAPFLSLRFVGPRFEGGALPLGVLQDLSVLQEMVIEVARMQFRAANPHRQRCPPGFGTGLVLRLESIRVGSTVADISLGGAPLPLVGEDRWTRSRDAILAEIRAAHREAPLPGHLPEDALPYFDRLGRSLVEGEAIELSAPEQEPATLSRASRRKLLLATPAAEMTERVVTWGRVPELDQDRMSFEFQLLDGRKIKAPLTSQHRDSLLRAFNEYSQNMWAKIDGVGLLNRQGKLLGMEDVELVSDTAPLDVIPQLSELLALEDGWLDGAGVAPDRSGILWLARAFEARFSAAAPLPHLYPTESGGVLAEWTCRGTEVSLEVDLEARTGLLAADDVERSSSEEQALDLNTPESWHRLSARLQTLESPTG